EGVRREGLLVVAGDAARSGEGAAVELAAVRVFVADGAAVGVAAGMAFGEGCGCRRVAVGAGDGGVGALERKARCRVLGGGDRQLGGPEIRMRRQVAGAAGAGRVGWTGWAGWTGRARWTGTRPEPGDAGEETRRVR